MSLTDKQLAVVRERVPVEYDPADERDPFACMDQALATPTPGTEYSAVAALETARELWPLIKEHLKIVPQKEDAP